MDSFSEKIRAPQRGTSFRIQLLKTTGIIVSGLILGILQKWLDSSSDIILPSLLQSPDISNYFGRLAVWILIATVISVYSETPLRASVNTFMFFISMLTGYYTYCNYVLGFLPKSYMMIWVAVSFASLFMAYICWYAKGNGIIAITISGVILGVLLSQAIIFTKGIYITHFTEVVTWLIGVIVLYRKPREFATEMALSVCVAFIYQLVFPYFG